MQHTDQYYMRRAMYHARKASEEGEVPIGAVLVCNGHIISSGHNRKELKRNALLHAEIIAIDRGCRKKGAWRLEDCTLYVTMEPCPMCAGAIVNARIQRLVFGCYDYKAGAYGSIFNLHDFPLNHYYEVTGGILETECAKLLSNFFSDLRVSKKKNRQLPLEDK